MSSGASFNVNTFDAIVMCVVGISAMVAFFRGFVRELLSLGAWVGAAIVTIYVFPHSTEFMKSHLHKQNPQLAAGIGALGTYISALIGFSLLNSIILRYMKTGAEVGIFDNLLGLVFGFVRGAFIVSLGFLIMSSVIPKDNPPDWLKKSITRKSVESGADFLANISPKYLHDLEGIVKKKVEEAKKERDGEPGGDDADKPKENSKDDTGENTKEFDNLIKHRFPMHEKPSAGGTN